jgi:fluoroacetyl-CoA thioesterase
MTLYAPWLRAPKQPTLVYKTTSAVFMNQHLKVGSAGEVQFTVERLHSIVLSDEQLPAVLSTPSLIWYLEQAAREVVATVLQSNQTSVGTHVDIQHLAPTPLGHQVTCRARVIQCEWPVISFQVEARDEHEVIARGLHQRRVVNCDRFAQRVQAKTRS